MKAHIERDAALRRHRVRVEDERFPDYPMLDCIVSDRMLSELRVSPPLSVNELFVALSEVLEES